MELARGTFLGQSIGGGVIPAFHARLQKVEAALREEHARVSPGIDFVAWCGITSVGGFRTPGGFHAKGVAVDLNYLTNGYMATRTGGTYGGEYAARDLGVRKPALDACDRACLAFDGAPADLSARKSGESTGAVWDRWHRVSEAVRAYFAPYFPAHDALDIGAADVLPGIDPASIPAQVMADYQAIRVPLVVGAPSKNPRTTRNPARCLMDIPRHVAVAMCDVGGMRWGACDFGAGSSGDVMHFDCPRLA